MRLNWKASGFGIGILTLILLMAPAVRAQVATATLSGTVSEPSGAVIPNVKVTIENLATGQSAETRTDADGVFRADNLSPGEYRVSFSVGGLDVRTTEMALASGAHETRNIVLGLQLPSSSQEQQNLPNAPSSTPSKPSLSDLGFPLTEIRGSAQEQAKLDRRTHMLTIHQRLGLVTAGALAATVITGSFVGEDSTSPSTRDLHAALGSATAGLYFTTAYFAIRAPRISGMKTRGPIRLHKTLAWIHGPGMILTPVLGALAFEQRRRGQEVHGIASAHAPVAYVTALAYGAAILSVSLKF